MSALPMATLPRIEIEPEARAYAEEKGEGDLLDRLVAAVPRVFPTFQGVRVALVPDAEMADYFFVVFTVALPPEDYIAGLGKSDRWYDEYAQACPGFCWVSFTLSVEKAG